MYSPLAIKAIDPSRPIPIPIPIPSRHRRPSPSPSPSPIRYHRPCPRPPPTIEAQNSVTFNRTRTYNFQKDFIIVLNARFHCTYLLLYHNASKRVIGISRPNNGSVYYETLQEFINEIGGKHGSDIQPNGLDKVEEQFFKVLQFFHDKELFFPVETTTIHISLPLNSDPNNPAQPELFLPSNGYVDLARNKRNLSAWKADQVSDAKSFFHVAKALLRLSHSPSRPIVLDLESQHALNDHLPDLGWDELMRHSHLCANVAPMIPKLACELMSDLVALEDGHKARDVFEAFFGGPVPSPEPDTPPDALYHSFVQLPARACHAGLREDGPGWDQDLEDQLQIGSPETLRRLVHFRVAIANQLGEDDEERWRLVGKSLHNAILLEKASVKIR